MLKDFKIINYLITKKEKRTLFVLIFLLIIGMFFEIIGLGIIFPVLKIVLDPSIVYGYFENTFFYDSIIDLKKKTLIAFFLIILVFVYLIKTFFLIFLTYRQNKILQNLNKQLTNTLFSKYLFQEYESYISSHTSSSLKNIQVEVPIIINYFGAWMTIIIESFLIISVLGTLIYIEPFGAILIGVFFTFFSLSFSFLSKNKLKSWGFIKHKIEGEKSKLLVESFGGFKEYKILGKQEKVVSRLSDINNLKSNIQTNYITLAQTPRFLLEFISITGLVIFILILLSQDNNIEKLISVIGVFVAATFRMIPSLNRIVSQSQHLKHDRISLISIYNELKNLNLTVDSSTYKDSLKEDFLFQNKIELNNISLVYKNKPLQILNNFNLCVSKGDIIGIMGPSGSGKSSVINILLGLIKPTKGEVLIDNFNIHNDINSYRKLLGYVPQDIFLIDDTLEKNIALGLNDSDIDNLKVKKCIELSQLKDFVEVLPKGVKTFVGERGVQISGGQKQRIGIARSLYNEPEILIFDEATSALDNETELDVMKSIYGLSKNKTIIIVSHRLNTLSKCNKIIKL